MRQPFVIFLFPSPTVILRNAVAIVHEVTSDGSMADDILLTKIQDLSDLELATLLSLISNEHCIIDTEPDSLDDLVYELRLIASNIFGLTHAVVDCSAQTTVDDFAASLFTQSVIPSRSESPIRTRQDSYLVQQPGFRSASRSSVQDLFNDKKKIAHIIIAKNLDEAPKQVQIQALELVRTKRIFTHTSVQYAPSRFLLLALVAGGEGPRLMKHLNDYMFMSHYHDPEDGYPNLAELDNDSDSISSVIRKRAINAGIEAAPDPIFSEEDLETLAKQSENIIMTTEMIGYMRNIIAFLRLHRAVAGGVSPVATKYFDKLVKSLAPIHGLTYVTPSMVSLAAKKIYPNRILIVSPQKERSMQWGSNIDAVVSALGGVGPEAVIDDVLATVEVPL